MLHLKKYTREEIDLLVRKREGEERIGEKVKFVSENDEDALNDRSRKYALIGIAEDIGVRANHGRPGAATAVKPALDSFLNQQQNIFLDGSTVAVIGEVETVDLMQKAKELDHHREEDLKILREFVGEIDIRVKSVVTEVIRMGKIPIVIGGGHNNSYGCIAGAVEALGSKINVVNCDPHLDFREREGRHSGNGFTYAFFEEMIEKYSVLGVHEQYNNAYALKQFRDHPSRLYFNTFESVFVREELSFKEAVRRVAGFVTHGACGLELDIDAITNVPSSARTSSGISALQARQFVHICASNLKPVYFHIAEAAPVLAHIRADNKTGKLIAYLISDFIKASEASGKQD